MKISHGAIKVRGEFGDRSTPAAVGISKNAKPGTAACEICSTTAEAADGQMPTARFETDAVSICGRNDMERGATIHNEGSGVEAPRGVVASDRDSILGIDNV